MEIELNTKARALIFDIDGTLADTMPVHHECWDEVFIKNDINCTSEFVKRYAGVPTIKIVEEINKKFNMNLNVEDIVKQKDKAYISKIWKVKPINVVAELVYKYHDILPIAVGTGSFRHIARLTLKAVKLLDYFKIIVTAEDIERHKPFPDTFLKCAELLNTEPEFCQVFEDTEMGFRAVENAGMILTDINKYL